MLIAAKRRPAAKRLFLPGLFTALAFLLSSSSPALPASQDGISLASGLGVSETGALSLHVDGEAWGVLYRSGTARITGFPLPDGGAADLEVASFDLIGPRTRFFVGNPDLVKETPGPDMRFFRGTVSGDPDSVVSLNLFGGRIAGFIRLGDKEYSFGPRAFSPDAEGAADIRIWNAAEESSPEGACDGDEKAEVERSLGGMPAGEAITPTTLLVAKVAVEGTVEWVARQGGVTAAQLYTLNIMSQVSAVYESEVHVQIQVPYILMNGAEPDGYSGETNSTSTILSEMRTKWNGSATLRGVQRSTVHLFGSYPSGGSGRAYIDVLCDNVPASTASYDYGVSLMDGNGNSWERRMVAHELGHNFSSPHSHCFAPELDKCSNAETGCYSGTVVQSTGTIMSYCSTRLFTFHQRERDERLRPGAEAAYPACLQVAGNPGTVGELTVSPAPICGAADLVNDDGAGNGMYGFPGAARASWVKRFTPPCHPFKLTGMDVRISHSSVTPGRPLKMVVYVDPTGSGSIANASLVRTQDVAVQVVSATQWNTYTLASPVLIDTGDAWIGFFDQVQDTATNYIMDYDTRTATDSWYQQEATEPTTFGPMPGSGTGSWMIRGHGGGVAPGSVRLTWDPPCNETAVPGQDFAVYQGSVGSWSSYTSLTCTTGHDRSWLIENPPTGVFWLIVPQTAMSEGSYGQTSAGERLPAAAPCRPQASGQCQ